MIKPEEIPTLYQKLKSHIARDFRPSAVTQNTIVGGGGATSFSGLTGTIANAQAPQFLLRDGSRSLTGSLSVDAGVTIDGIDISAHAADANAHHNQQHSVTGGDHTITGAALSLVGATAINTLGLIAPSSNPGTTESVLKATSGLLTLPNFTATTSMRAPLIDTASGALTLQPAGTDVVNINTLLTGGFGARATTGTLDWNDATNARPGSGHSLMQRFNSINAPPNPPIGALFHPFSFEYATKTGAGNITQFAIPYATAASIDAGVHVRGRYLGTWTNWAKLISENTSGNVLVGTYTDGGYKFDVTGTARITTSLTTPLLTTASNVDLVINPAGTGAVQFPNDQTLRTSSFDSSFPINGWQINEVAGVAGYSALTIGKIQADELAVRVFVADEVRVDRGDEFWTKSYGIIAATFTTPSAIGGTVSVKFEDSPALAGAIFVNNDWVLIRKLEIDTGINLFNVWGQVATYVNNSDGTQNWTFTLRSGPTSTEITKGSLAIDFGASGAALIHLSVIDAAGAPYIKMRKWSGANPYTPANFTTYVQLGHLGSTGNAFVTPAGFGLYARSTNDASRFLLADDNGLQIRGASFKMYNSSLQTVDISATDGSVKLGTNIASSTTTALNFNGATGDLAITGDLYTGKVYLLRASGINTEQDVWGSWDNRRALQWWPDLTSMTGDPSLSMYTGKHSGGSFPNQNWAYIDSNPTGGVLASLSLTAGGQGTGADATIYIEGGSQSLASTPSVTITASAIDLVAAVAVTGSLSVNGTAVSLDGHTHSYLPLSGGTLTGTLTSRAVTPSADNTYDLGASGARWQDLYAVNLHVGTIVGTPSYSHSHAASDITSGTLDFARMATTWTGALTLDADSAGTSNYVRWLTQTSTGKAWDFIGRAHDFATAAQQNDLLLTYYDGSTTHVVLQADNATRIVNFGQTPTVGGTVVSLSGHAHDDRYFTETESDARYVQTATLNGYLLADGTRAGATSQAQVLSNGVQVGLGSAAAPSISFVGDTDSGLMLSAANKLGFVTNATEWATLDSAGLFTVAKRLTAGWVRNSMIGFGGQGANDLGMLGFYDRNELTNADLRGTVTITITGAGTVTTSTINNAFNALGNFMTITGTDNTTTQIVFHVDLGANQSNYGSAFWQPFLQYRLTMNNVFTHYRTIVCEVSTDNATWYKPSGGLWETTSAHTSEIVPGLWLGQNGNPSIPGSTYRYVRFTLTNRFEDAGYSSKASVWISQVGLRHYAARTTRAWMHTSGDTMYGQLLVNATSSGAFDVRTAGASSIFKVNTSSAIVTVTGDLDVSDNLLLAAGSASLPALAGSADTNTGLYWSAADVLAVTTGGVQRATFSSAGLAVPTSVSTPSLITASGTLTIAPANSTTAVTGALSLTGTLSSTSWNITSAGAATVVTAAASTKVTTPLIDTASGSLTLTPAGGTVAVTAALTVGTNATIAGVASLASGSVGAPGLTFTGDTNTGIYRSGVDAYSLVAGGAAIINVGATGAGVNAAYDSTAALKVQSVANDDITLFLKQKSGQTARMWRVEDSAGQELIVLDSQGNLQSGNPGFVSGLTGWQITPVGNAELNNAFIRGELHASIFVMDEFHASGGTLYIAPAGKLENDAIVYTATGVQEVLDVRTTSGTFSGTQVTVRTTSGSFSGTTVTRRFVENYFDITDPPSGHAMILAPGDIIRCKALGLGGVGINLWDVWGVVTRVEDMTDYYRYYYERKSGGADDLIIPAGTAIISYGAPGDGRIYLTADQNYAPYMQVFLSGEEPWNGQITPTVRIGRLDGVGLPGVSGIEQHGIVLSSDLSNAAAPYLVASNLQMFSYKIDSEWNNGNPTARITANGEFRLGTDVDADVTTGLKFNPATGALDIGNASYPGAVNVRGVITVTGGSGYSNFSDRPTSLSGINAGEGTKLNAGLDSTGSLITKVLPGSTIGTPAGAGLFLGSDRMGYYNGSRWLTHMDNTGAFTFSSATSAKIAWDGTDLYGTDGTNVQWYARASTGKLYAGNGTVVLDSTGILVANGNASAGITLHRSNAFTSSTKSGRLWALSDLSPARVYFSAGRSVSEDGDASNASGIMDIIAYNSSGVAAAMLSLRGDSGATTVTGDLNMNGNDIIDASTLGVGTASPDGLQVNASVSETARGVDNVRLGVAGGSPRIIFEDAGSTQWEIDNNAGTFRWFQPGSVKASLNGSGNLTLTGTVATALGSAWDLGGYTTTAPSATGYVTIKIGGTTYKLLAST